MDAATYSATIEYEQLPSMRGAQGVIHELNMMLKKLADEFKRDLTLHFAKGPGFAPFLARDGEAHFVIGAAPPGAYETVEYSHICGLRISMRGRHITMWGPSAGRGVRIHDDEGAVIAQVVGTTMYLFVPTPLVSTPLFEGNEGCVLYEKVMRRVLKTCIITMGDQAIEVRKEAEFETLYVEMHNDSMMQVIDESIAQSVTEVAEYSDKLRGAMATLRFSKLMREYEIERLKRDKKALLKSWPRILNNTLVSKLFVSDAALHVQTVDIVAEHEGKHYDYGPFMLRLPVGGTPTLWALDPRDPRRLGHPHISETGIVCFGNITSSLMDAAGHSRIAEEVEMMLNWLVNGYDPALATTKIEEWPLVEKKQIKRKSGR